jgi:hypothetical protein
MGGGRRIGLGLLGLLLIAAGVSIALRFWPQQPDVSRDRSKIRVRILNGCGVPRQASRSADALRELGFDVLEIGNTAQRFESTVLVEHTSSDLGNALELARVIGYPKGQIVLDLDTLLLLDVTVILGEDFTHYFPDLNRYL